MYQYRNQYIVAKRCLKNQINSQLIKNFNTVEFEGLDVYVHIDLNCTVSLKDNVKILLIGFILDPFNPDKSNANIINRISNKYDKLNDLIKEFQSFSGRFVALIKTIDDFVVFGDACHLRQIYYSIDKNNIAFTSSPKLFFDFFSLDISLNNKILKVISHPEYLKREGAWFGDTYLDERLKKLLPNHFLDLISLKANRVPVYDTYNFIDENQSIEFASNLLVGTFDSILNRFKPIQGLTAGWDSRLLLAASKRHSERIKYYVFNQLGSLNNDAIISSQISKKLGVPFETILVDSSNLTDEYSNLLKSGYLYPLLLPKLANIQYHYYKRYSNDTININGNASGIATCVYGFSKNVIPLKMLLYYSGYLDKITYFCDEIGKWYPSALEYSKQTRIPLLDLFYWEQRMGNWGSIFPYMQDMAIEEITPFNNKDLLLSLLKIEPKNRLGIENKTYRRIMQILWPEVLLFPFNPDRKFVKLKKFLLLHAKLRYRINYFLR